MDKVIFLDIDGPMIPDTMILAHLLASFERRMPPTTVAVINALCQRAGALIVTNSTHNKHFTEDFQFREDGEVQTRSMMNAEALSDKERTGEDIQAALIRNGVKAEFLHPDPKTLYPAMPRDLAVKDWLNRHPEVTRYVAFDDARFTQEKYLIWTDPDYGLSIGHLNQALKYFGVRHPVLIF